ncbi:hypothetical protein ACJZ2D_016506 [Fusarium nematophilum]
MPDRFAVVSNLFPELDQMQAIALPLDSMGNWPWRSGARKPCFRGMRRLLLFEREKDVTQQQHHWLTGVNMSAATKDFTAWESLWRKFIEKHQPFGDRIPEIQFVVVKHECASCWIEVH